MTELYEKSLRKLELDNVLAQLADCANSEDGKDRCRALLPLDDAEEIRLLQQQTTAACGMIVRKGAPGFHELKPVAASLERADRPPAPWTTPGCSPRRLQGCRDAARRRQAPRRPSSERS